MRHVPRASIWSTIGGSLVRWVPSCQAGWEWTIWPKGTAEADPGQVVARFDRFHTPVRDNTQMLEYKGSFVMGFYSSIYTV
jgi:hypothetical protein